MFNKYVVILFLFCFPIISHAGVSLSHYRIEFEPNQRLQHLYLFNPSEEAQTYRISFVDMEMKPDGRLEQSEGVTNSAKKYVRISPRQIKIAPNGNQTIKLLARNSHRLDVGELRSHLLLTEVPKETSNDINQALENSLSDDEVSVGLQMTTSLSIPVFVRKVPSINTQVSLDSYSFIKKDNQLSLSMQFNRYGNTSVYSDIDVYAGKGSEPIAMLRSMGFYYPLTQRTVNLNLDKWDGHSPLKLVVKRHETEQIFVSEDLSLVSALAAIH